MRASCARSASTARRPISTPTSRRITTSISRTTTSWSTSKTRIWCCRRCPKCPRATRSPGSTWSCGCARSADLHQTSSRRTPGPITTKADCSRKVSPAAPHRKVTAYGSPPSRGRQQKSIHLLVGVDAPEPLLLDPAVKAGACDMAPAGGAMLDLRDDPGLQARADCARRIGAFVERGEVVLVLHRNDSSAAAGQKRVIDPALGAFGIAHPAPVLELGGNLDRQARAGIDPGHVIVLGGTGADVHMVGFEADITRDGQAAGGGAILGRSGATRRYKEQANQKHPRTKTPHCHQRVSRRDQLKFVELRHLYP